VNWRDKAKASVAKLLNEMPSDATRDEKLACLRDHRHSVYPCSEQGFAWKVWCEERSKAVNGPRVSREPSPLFTEGR